MQNNVASRSSLLERVADARRRSDALFGIVQPASLYDRPIPERHRIIFYVGHLEAFDWNLLHESIFGPRSFHPEFDRLFAFGIDPVDGGLPSDQPSDWPSLGSVRDYEAESGSHWTKSWREFKDARTDTGDGFSLDTLLNVAIEHRLMHVETLAYMLHQLPLEKKERQAAFLISSVGPVSHRSIAVPEGVAALGLARGSGASAGTTSMRLARWRFRHSPSTGTK